LIKYFNLDNYTLKFPGRIEQDAIEYYFTDDLPIPQKPVVFELPKYSQGGQKFR
jgi:hypothetical protein